MLPWIFVGHEYAGLENHKACFCGDQTYARHGEVENTECSYVCTGNNKQLCGGPWRLSVYRIFCEWITQTSCVGLFTHSHRNVWGWLILSLYISPLPTVRGLCLGFFERGLGVSVVLKFVVWTIKGSGKMWVAKCSGFHNTTVFCSVLFCYMVLLYFNS